MSTSVGERQQAPTHHHPLLVGSGRATPVWPPFRRLPQFGAQWSQDYCWLQKFLYLFTHVHTMLVTDVRTCQGVAHYFWHTVARVQGIQARHLMAFVLFFLTCVFACSCLAPVLSKCTATCVYIYIYDKLLKRSCVLFINPLGLRTSWIIFPQLF